LLRREDGTKSLRFECGDPCAGGGQLVVATPLVVELRSGTFARLSDQLVIDEPFDDAIEIARLEMDKTIRRLGDCVSETIPVLLAFDEREQEMEVDRPEREKVSRISAHGVGEPI
jgi:hypothetical protein